VSLSEIRLCLAVLIDGNFNLVGQNQYGGLQAENIMLLNDCILLKLNSEYFDVKINLKIILLLPFVSFYNNYIIYIIVSPDIYDMYN